MNWSNTLTAPDPAGWLARQCWQGSFLPTELGMCATPTSVVGWLLMLLAAGAFLLFVVDSNRRHDEQAARFRRVQDEHDRIDRITNNHR